MIRQCFILFNSSDPTTFPKEASEEAQNLAKEATSKWGSPSGIGTDLFHFPAGSFFWCMVNLSFQFGFFGDERYDVKQRSFELMMPSSYVVPPTAFGQHSQVGLLRTQSRRLPQQSHGAEISVAVGELNHLFSCLTDRGSGQQMGNHHRLHQ